MLLGSSPLISATTPIRRPTDLSFESEPGLQLTIRKTKNAWPRSTYTNPEVSAQIGPPRAGDLHFSGLSALQGVPEDWSGDLSAPYCHSFDGLFFSKEITTRPGRLMARRNGKVIFPSWPGARRRICPLQERSVGLLGTLFLGTCSQAYRYRPPCGPTPGVLLEAHMRASLFFSELSFYRLRLYGNLPYGRSLK